MKKRELNSLDKNDDKVVEVMNNLGMPKNIAKTIMYVSQVDECRATDIEQGADLRQPEVSIAINDLMEKGWVTKREEKKRGKGRPVHIYKHTLNLSEIFKTIEQGKLEEFKTIDTGLSELKTIIGYD